MEYGINNSIGKPAKEDVIKILDFASKKGIRILDSADAYGDALSIIAEFTSKNSKSFGVNSKFILGEDSIQSQLQKSLSLLGISSFSTYYYHNIKDLDKSPHTISELNSLKQRKLINQIGVSVYTNYEFKRVIDISEIDVIQFPFNLLDNNFQRGQLIKEAKKKNKELHARSIFLQGLFFKSPEELPVKLKPLKPYLKEIRRLSEANKIEIAALSLVYALRQTNIDYIIIGVDSLEQIKKTLSYLLLEVDTNILDIIDNIKVRETELLNPVNWN